LLELFAHLSEVMIYRLNRLPDKIYIEFLRLIGIRLTPPAAATVILRFSRIEGASDSGPIVIPRGTRVTVNRTGGGGPPPIFMTIQAVTLPSGQPSVDVQATHAEQIEGELAGLSNGQPGFTVTARQTPIIAESGDGLDLLVGVETPPGELSERVAGLKFNGKNYRIWREVRNFTDKGPDGFVFVADRMTGTIYFAPAARMENEAGQLAEDPVSLAEIPPAGREVRLWYRHGGGSDGNVSAGTLTTLKDPILGVAVTNPSPATGGRAAESLENARIRGPEQLRSSERAVTARDFELIALQSSNAIARARPVTRAELWTFAAPGTVEVILVPFLPENARGGGNVNVAKMLEQQTSDARDHIQKALDERRPLGITCLVNWARYKSVRVAARVVVRWQEDREAVKRRVIERLHQTINPLRTAYNSTGWNFGQALRTSDVFDIALAEPGVRWVDRVRLIVEEVPEKDVRSLVADVFQPRTWYAGAGSILYRSVNDGNGWEPAGRFPDESIEVVEVHSRRPGLVAVAAALGSGGSRIHLSRDCGETWEESTFTTSFHINDMVWTIRNEAPLLILATDVGLFELLPRSGAGPVQVALGGNAPTGQGFFSVVTFTDLQGVVSVAAVANSQGGVYLSSDGGKPNTFRRIGLDKKDIRKAVIQTSGSRGFLWAAAAAAGGDSPGEGAFRWELRGTQDPPEGWVTFSSGWTGGSCRDLAFSGSTVLAGSHRGGVMRLDTSTAKPTWLASEVRCGLPLRDQGRFFPVATVASAASGELILAGGEQGVYASTDVGVNYTLSSRKEFTEAVTLPATWLFVSGAHDIQVVNENEAE
jgi:hypothetical protein